MVDGRPQYEPEARPLAEEVRGVDGGFRMRLLTLLLDAPVNFSLVISERVAPLTVKIMKPPKAKRNVNA